MEKYTATFKAEYEASGLTEANTIANGIVSSLYFDNIQAHVLHIEKSIPEEIDDGFCTTCNGTGEGMYDGHSCTKCQGSGEYKRKPMTLYEAMGCSKLIFED